MPAIASATYIPYYSALWANMAPLTTSPIPQIFGTFVLRWSSTITLPLSSTLTPALSSPNPYVWGFLPVEIKIWSALRTCLSPPLTGSIVIYPEVPLFLPETTLCPVNMVIPCLTRILWKLLATSVSRNGQI